MLAYILIFLLLIYLALRLLTLIILILRRLNRRQKAIQISSPTALSIHAAASKVNLIPPVSFFG